MSERDEMTVFREDGDEEYAPNELGPPAALDGAVPTEPEPATDDDLPQIEGALRLLRRGLRETPELRAGIGYTIGLAMARDALTVWGIESWCWSTSPAEPPSSDW